MASFGDKHPSDAILHAFEAGEVDPAQRAAIAAHAEECTECRDTLERIRAVRLLFAWSQPPPLDELTWRRIGYRVQAQLESDAVSGSVQDPEGLGRSGWVVAGLLAAAAVAAFVWFAPRRARVTPEPPLATRTHAISSGERPLEVTLDSGAHLRLAEDTRIRATEPESGKIRLELDAGELDVALPWRPRSPDAFTISTPDVLALAAARDFSVGYRAREFFVAVREGEVHLEPTGQPPRVISAGDSALLRFRPDPASPPVGPPAAEPTPRKRPPPENARAGSSSPRITPIQTATRGTVVRLSQEGDTNVQVEAPPEDALAGAWQRASAAYYLERDLPAAIRLAEGIVREEPRYGAGRAEVGLARDLLCEAYIATRQPHRAVEACQAVLRREPRQERARELHYKLATIYRTQLSDCRKASEAYSRVIVFGRSSILDDEALLWRAHCAIELGDRDSALRDLTVLEARLGSIARPEEVIELRRRFAGAQMKGAAPTP